MFVNPIIVMSKYLRMRLELEPEAAEKLLYFGKYLAALVRMKDREAPWGSVCRRRTRF